MIISEAKERIKKMKYDSDIGKNILDRESEEALFMALVALEKFEKIRSVVIRQDLLEQRSFVKGGKVAAYDEIKKIIYGEGRDE